MAVATPFPDREFKAAVETLFGSQAALTKDDLRTLDLEALKIRFRKKAIAHHPDRAVVLGRDPADLTKSLVGIIDSYHFLSTLAAAHRRVAFAKNAWNDFFHTGNVPEKKLRFAEFLFYKKIISWKTLVEMICKQGQRRPKMGEIGLGWNYFNFSQMLEVIKGRQLRERFGEAALRMGAINQYQLFAMLGKQRAFNVPMGRIFVEEKILTEGELSFWIGEFNGHNSRF